MLLHYHRSAVPFHCFFSSFFVQFALGFQIGGERRGKAFRTLQSWIRKQAEFISLYSCNFLIRILHFRQVAEVLKERMKLLILV
ncbi:hypothetical protein ACS0TY_003449 [Phlomoides rotata]